MRPVLITLLIIGIAVFVFRYFYSGDNVEISYIKTQAVNGHLSEVVTSSGALKAVVTVEVSSQLSGQVSSVHADFNDEVIKGQLLAVIDQKSYEARLAQANAELQIAHATVLVRKSILQRKREDLRKTEAMKAVHKARLDSARASLAVAESDLSRKERLKSDGTIPASVIDTVRATQRTAAADVREAKANFDAHEIDIAAANIDIVREKAELLSVEAAIPQKEALLKLAKVELEQTAIRAPIDGVIIDKDVDEGQTVATSLEAPTLFTIAQDLSEMEVHALVDETDIGKIKLGQKANFSVDAYPDRKFTAEVTQIRKEPEVVQNVVIYTVVLRTSNMSFLLLPGMTAVVEIIVMQSDEQLLIPTAALRYTPKGQAGTDSDTTPRVWRMVNGELEAVEVKIGLSDASDTSLLGGELKEGDEVVVNEIARQVPDQIFGIRIGF